MEKLYNLHKKELSWMNEKLYLYEWTKNCKIEKLHENISVK